MKPYLTPRQFTWVAAIALVLLVGAVAVIQGRHGEDAGLFSPLGSGEADALALELARCRTIAPNDTAALESCRRTWAENRRHFFVLTKSPQPPVAPVPNPSTEPVKSQDQFPPFTVDQGRTR